MDPLALNCDLGENESAVQTGRLMALVDAANICCGVHAGSPFKTHDTIRMAADAEVAIGAHPGIAAAGGRGSQALAPSSFRGLLDEQVGGFIELADGLGVTVDHLKLHGALYHAVETSEALREELLQWMQARSGLKLYCLAGGTCLRQAGMRGIETVPEIFADRGYRACGQLVQRGAPGALICDPDAVVARLSSWRETGRMPCVDGSTVDLRAATVCVHADSPGAADLIRAIRSLDGFA